MKSNFQQSKTPDICYHGCLQPTCGKATSGARAKSQAGWKVPADAGVVRVTGAIKDLSLSVGLHILYSQTDVQESTSEETKFLKSPINTPVRKIMQTKKIFHQPTDLCGPSFLATGQK